MAEHIEVQGMVIASSPVGDYDKRVVLLTKELGKISAFAKGARKPGNHLMAAVDSFAFGKFILYAGKNSYTIEKAEIKEYFRDLTLDAENVYYGYYFLELADYYAREGQREEATLLLLYYTLKALSDERIPNKLIRAVYELKMLVINGQYPEFFECTCCKSKNKIVAFSMNNDGVLCDECFRTMNRGYKISPSALYTLQFIVAVEINKLYTFVVKEDVLTELTVIMKQCMAAYIDKEIKSLEILNMLYRGD